MHKHPGLFVVFDGPDGGGKGVMIDTLCDLARQKDKKILYLDKFLNETGKHPAPSLLNKFDVILSSEPTYWGVGEAIREEIIRKNNPFPYSACETGWAYALDRAILYRKVVLPALELGKTIIQSRSVASSLAYQTLQSKENNEKLVMKDFIRMDGNKLAIQNSMDVLFIPTVAKTEDLVSRLENRNKKDNVIFENLDFLTKLRNTYSDKKFTSIFENTGTVVRYIDTSQSIEATKENTLREFNLFLEQSRKSF